MTLIEELKFRGFLNQCTNEETLNEKINSNKINFYIGFDCTAKSLHVGSLIQIMIMRLFQKYGHKPIVLIGKGTTRIGDPSGKDETRKILSDDEIDLNAKNLKQVFDRFLLSDNEVSKWVTRDNSEWLDKLNYVNFLRDYGKHFTINKMLSFDSVKIRLDREQSLNFVEFNYMIFQAYDFFELNNRDNCILQIGGSDQWGNIVNGVELIRRASGKETFGLTTPLLTNANGDKMGKTSEGAIWLNEDMLSAYDYWQFWRNVDDRDVIRFLKLFTDLSKKEIESIEKGNADNINETKIILANEATAMLHGLDMAKKSEETAKNIFADNNLSTDLPTIELTSKELEKEILISDLILRIDFASSKSASRKLIRGNAVKIDKELIKDELFSINTLLSNSPNGLVISVGKKKYFRVVTAE
ncbi:tyrosine--tRNA ligase [Pelagibacteraceae bacterium]|nr:tyrosine--tRNA ligase [Pelagibacteraceae bacterium]